MYVARSYASSTRCTHCVPTEDAALAAAPAHLQVSRGCLLSWCVWHWQQEHSTFTSVDLLIARSCMYTSVGPHAWPSCAGTAQTHTAPAAVEWLAVITVGQVQLASKAGSCHLAATGCRSMHGLLCG
jgi:hypothetical protein